MTGPTRPRLCSIDIVRGLAITGVVLFHLVWDLDFTGLLPGNLAYHPAWLLFGRSLASTFMVLVGVSLALAHGGGIRWRAFFKRLAVILAAALAISLLTLLVFPEAFIYFGILHAITAASLIGILFVPFAPPISVLVGLAVILAPALVSSPLFDARWLAWIGFAENPPVSNDYAPIFPSVGFTLLGLGIAKASLARGFDQWIARHEPSGSAAGAMVWLGRHSLAIYLLHQPVLLAMIVPLAWALTCAQRGAAAPRPRPAYSNQHPLEDVSGNGSRPAQFCRDDRIL